MFVGVTLCQQRGEETATLHTLGSAPAVTRMCDPCGLKTHIEASLSSQVKSSQVKCDLTLTSLYPLPVVRLGN